MPSFSLASGQIVTKSRNLSPRGALQIDRHRTNAHSQLQIYARAIATFAGNTMLTELVLEQAAKSILGFGFTSIIRSILKDSRHLGDEEVVRRIVEEIRKQGGQIQNLDERLARLENLISTSLLRPPNSQSSLPTPYVRPAHAQVYCRWCGATPGESTACKTFAAHTWEALENVHCQWCGAVPGLSTKCATFSSHTWIKMGSVYCQWCGAVPGKVTKCATFSSHTWTPMANVYCRWCGAVPGSVTKCSTFSSHTWESY